MEIPVKLKGIRNSEIRPPELKAGRQAKTVLSTIQDRDNHDAGGEGSDFKPGLPESDDGKFSANLPAELPPIFKSGTKIVPGPKRVQVFLRSEFVFSSMFFSGQPLHGSPPKLFRWTFVIRVVPFLAFQPNFTLRRRWLVLNVNLFWPGKGAPRVRPEANGTVLRGPQVSGGSAFGRILNEIRPAKAEGARNIGSAPPNPAPISGGQRKRPGQPKILGPKINFSGGTAGGGGPCCFPFL